MSFLRRVQSLAWRGVKALFKLLYLVVRVFFVLLMLVIPIPILLKPEITNLYRRNQITQVERKKVPD
jgi:hypothetical protein